MLNILISFLKSTHKYKHISYILFLTCDIQDKLASDIKHMPSFYNILNEDMHKKSPYSFTSTKPSTITEN
jgi:hypothetical protein